MSHRVLMSREDRGKIRTVSPNDLSLLKSYGVFYLQHVNLHFLQIFTFLMYITSHNIAIFVKKHIYFMYTELFEWYVSSSTLFRWKQNLFRSQFKLQKNPHTTSLPFVGGRQMRPTTFVWPIATWRNWNPQRSLVSGGVPSAVFRKPPTP